MIDHRCIWNVIYIARSNRSPCPESPNIVPAKQNDDYHNQLLGATEVTVQSHQILCLPRKMTRMLNPRDTWNVIYNKRSSMCHPPTIPNTAPATQNDHPKSDRNLVKTPSTVRGRSEHDPRPIRAWSDHEPVSPTRYFSRSPRAFCIEKYNVSRSGYLSKFHHVLRLPRKVTLEHHQVLRLPRIVTPAPNTVPATKIDTLPSHYYLTIPITWWYVFLDDTYYLKIPTTPITWRYLAWLLLDDTYYVTIPITWRYLLLDDTYYLMICISWRYLLLEDTYYLMIPITWRYLAWLLLDDTYYVTIPITWRYLLLNDTYYLTLAITWRYLSWRYQVLDDTNYLTILFILRYLLLEDTYYLTILIT